MPDIMSLLFLLIVAAAAFCIFVLPVVVFIYMIVKVFRNTYL